jgi:hypothetical protein
LVFRGGVKLNGIDTSPKDSNPVRNGGIVFNLPSSVFTTQDIRNVAGKAGKMKEGALRASVT